MLMPGPSGREVSRRLRAVGDRTLIIMLKQVWITTGLSCAEIAAILGTTEGATKALLHRARAEFRRHYKRLAA